MRQQPAWRGHRAPVEGPDSPGVAGHDPRVGRQRRWPAVAAGAVIAVVVATVFTLIAIEERGASALPDIEVGTCLRSADIARGAASLHALTTVPCTASHDAEVFALFPLADGEDLDAAGGRCVAVADDHEFAAHHAHDLEVRPLALDDPPSAGDTVACFIRRQDGTPRSGAVFTTTESDR